MFHVNHTRNRNCNEQNTLFVQNNGQFAHFSHVILYVIAYKCNKKGDIIRRKI